MRILTLPGVFRPRSDSWMLAQAIRRHPVQPDAVTLDLCTGSGLSALAAAESGAEAWAVDVSRRAVLTVRINGRLNGLHVNAVRGDLFDAVAGRRFDLISANPPYLPDETDALPSRGARRAWDAGRDGRAVLDRILREAPARLRPGGALLVIHSSICGTERTLGLMRDGGLQAEVIFRHLGPLGPLLTARATQLEERGLLAPGQREEEMVIVRGVAGR